MGLRQSKASIYLDACINTLELTYGENSPTAPLDFQELITLLKSKDIRKKLNTWIVRADELDSVFEVEDNKIKLVIHIIEANSNYFVTISPENGIMVSSPENNSLEK